MEIGTLTPLCPLPPTIDLIVTIEGRHLASIRVDGYGFCCFYGGHIHTGVKVTVLKGTIQGHKPMKKMLRIITY